MNSTVSEVQRISPDSTAPLEWGFVLKDKNGRPRASFGYATKADAEEGKRHMERALAKVQSAIWP